MLYIGNQQYKIPDRTFITPEHYDSKIEYLQSTGTQWIDTGIKGNTGLKLEVTIQAEKYSEGVIGARISSVRYEHSLVYIAEGGIRLHVSTTNNNLFIYNPSSYSEWLNIVCDKNNMYINGTKVGNAPGYTPFTNNYSYYVFAVNSSNKAQPIGSSKLKSVIIWDNDTKLIDFIPVRVGQIGYMYDKVSGKLFGNKGTGNFTLGPDIQEE